MWCFSDRAAVLKAAWLTTAHARSTCTEGPLSTRSYILFLFPTYCSLLRDPGHNSQTPLANLPQKGNHVISKEKGLAKRNKMGRRGRRIWGQWRKVIWEWVRRLAEQGEVSNKKPLVWCFWRNTLVLSAHPWAVIQGESSSCVDVGLVCDSWGQMLQNCSGPAEEREREVQDSPWWYRLGRHKCRWLSF